jgi:hypothetical protein
MPLSALESVCFERIFVVELNSSPPLIGGVCKFKSYIKGNDHALCEDVVSTPRLV